MPKSQDMKDPLKGSHVREGLLVGKLNIFHFLSNLTQFNGNLKIRCNSEFFDKKCKNRGGGILVTPPVTNFSRYE